MSEMQQIRKFNNRAVLGTVINLALVILLGMDDYAHAMDRDDDNPEELYLVNALSTEYQQILEAYSDDDLSAAAAALQLQRAVTDRDFVNYITSQNNKAKEQNESGEQLNSPPDNEMRERLEAAYMTDLLVQLAYQEKWRAVRAHQKRYITAEWTRALKISTLCLLPVSMLGFTLFASLADVCPAK